MNKDSAIKKYLKWIIFTIIVISAIIAIIKLQIQIKDQKELVYNFQADEQELAEKIERLESEIEYMKTDEYIERVARNKLGMVKKNEIVFQQMPEED